MFYFGVTHWKCITSGDYRLQAKRVSACNFYSAITSGTLSLCRSV